ncbi:MAG: PspC domain-containing protein [Bacteroidales bacterium]|nr:PspC domain-containing protein [Bacteroidales bacterium]
MNGKLFQIEEDACGYLQTALQSGQVQEAAVAAELEQRLSGGKAVITYPDVVDALHRLGYTQSTWNNPLTGKRLFRRTTGKILGGVCTGLGDYFDVDPVMVRVVFVLAGFFGSLGLWIYIAMWVIVPQKPLDMP